MIPQVRRALRKHADPKKKKVLQNFFKTGKGQYGEGDVFLGVTVPETRKVAKKYFILSLQDIKTLLESKVHEERLCALLILVNNYQLKKESEQEKIVKFYLKNTKRVNNWDLVDLTAPKILGDWLLTRNKSLLYALAASQNLWERRISMIATYRFIQERDFKDALKLAQFHLRDDHDLMHKAVGWMLREIGKKNQKALLTFLDTHYKEMPRTALRYAIERLDKKKKMHYMKS